MSMDGDGLRITLLGTGSPRPNLARSQPAALVSWKGTNVLVDCGDGTVQQLQRAGIDLPDVEHVIFTHMHWDHILGYPSLVWGGWSLGRTALSVRGPVGTRRMSEQLVYDYYTDQAKWVQGIGYDAAGWERVEIQEMNDGDSFELDGCHISAHRVLHPPIEALAYRFDYEGKSLVVSGDVAACDELIIAAADADLLIVDVCATAPEGRSPYSERMMRALRESHASAADAATMAARAGVGRMVCTHLLPQVDPETVVRQAVPYFSGAIEVGEDLQTYWA